MTRYALTNGYILDCVSKEMTPVAGKAIVIENDLIKDILEESKLDEAYVGIEKVDLDGGYVMPGLINLHIHMVITGKAPKSEKATDYKKLVQTIKKFWLVKQYFLASERSNMKNQLMSGVTTLRAVGGVDDWDGIVRDQIKSGRAIGPRILSANTGVSVPGGHFAGALATEAATPEQAAADVRAIAKTNPDLIKLMITGGVMDATEEGEPGALRMPLATVKAACEQAHELGYKVAAHVESTAGVRVALLGGVDTIEHGADIDEGIVKLFKEKGAADICTISPALPYAFMDMDVAKCGEVGRKNGKIVLDGIIDAAVDCRAAGIPVGLGTDTGCPFITHYDMWREIKYYDLFCGVSSSEALWTATMGNAKIIEMDDQIGSLEVGKQADFIVSAQNPLEDWETLRQLKMVAKAGVRYNNPQVKRDPVVDAALDAVVIPENYERVKIH